MRWTTSAQRIQHLRWVDSTWEQWVRWGLRRSLCRLRHHLLWAGAQRLQGADQVCRRSLLRHLHQCSHHQHRSFLRSSAKTHLRERLLLHRPDPMSCVPRRRLRGRQSRHRLQWRVCQRRPKRQSRQRSKVLLEEFSHEHLHQREQ